MKSLESIIKCSQTETVFYKLRIQQALGYTTKIIFVSSPLSFSEMHSFISSRTQENPNKVSIIEAFYTLTPIEKTEVYGLDSLARILALINNKYLKYWKVTVKESSNKGPIIFLKEEEANAAVLALATLGFSATCQQAC